MAVRLPGVSYGWRSILSERRREFALHKIVVLYPPQPDPEAFKAYYVEKHIPLARKLPGLQALRYTFDVAGVGGEPPYFCVFEAEFSDIGAFGAAMGSPEGAAVAADGPNYAQVPPVVIHYTVDASM
jgi:uncharacterized protein (TIGR02118 family)